MHLTIDSSKKTKMLSQSILLVIHLVLSALFYWGLYWLIKKNYVAVKGMMERKNISILNALLSFGVATFFFQTIVAQSFSLLIKIFTLPFEMININTTQNGQEATAAMNVLVDWLHNFRNIILSINFADLIIFFTAFLLIVLLFREVDQTSDEMNNQKKSGRFESFKNIFTYLLLGFSIYLCIASIVAVPEFNNLSAESETEKNQILQDLALELDNGLQTLGFNYLYESDTIIKNEYLIKEIELAIANRNENINKYNAWVNKSMETDNKNKSLIINKFRGAIDDKIGVKERTKYKQALVEWYADNQDNWVQKAQGAPQKIKGITDRFLAVIYDEESKIFDPNTRKYKITEKGDKELYRYNADLTTFINELSKSDSAEVVKSLPPRPKIGEEFGIFNSISGWLLETESLSLALIVGLFGFGLLGGIGSTYIRRSLKDGDNSYMANNLLGILINGLSAAIVVFLGVKGALMVFSSDPNASDNLNPYMLFFTCLVASVFSEDVWAWARGKLSQTLNTDDDNEEKETTEPENEEEALRKKKEIEDGMEL